MNSRSTKKRPLLVSSWYDDGTLMVDSPFKHIRYILESSARFARASGPGPWWAVPWALPWAFPWALGPPLGPGGALRGSGPAGPLVGPCRDRALRGPGP